MLLDDTNIIDFSELGKSLGMEEIELNIHGHVKSSLNWTVEYSRLALDKIREIAAEGKTVEFIGHPTKWLLCAAVEVCGECGFIVSIPAAGKTLEIPVLKTGVEGLCGLADYIVSKQEDDVFIRTVIKDENSHPGFEDMANMVPVNIPDGKNVFLKCDGVPLVALYWSRAYAQKAKSLWVTEDDGEYYCVMTKTDDFSLFDRRSV